MKFKIHGTYQDGTNDTWVIEGETIEEIRNAAMRIVSERALVDYWSEEV